MNIYTHLYKGLSCYCLENEEIRLVVIPELGAKIASVVYKPQAFEVFFQPTKGAYQLAEYGANFADYDTSGADEMFPTIDSCLYPYSDYVGREIPDHGELWSRPWDVRVIDGQLVAEVQGTALPYVFTRNITLEGNNIHLEYKVRNLGKVSLYGLWAFHGLVNCDELTKLILPDTEKIINVHNSQLLGPRGTEHSFPLTQSPKGKGISLDIVGTKSLRKTEKIYVQGKLGEGKAALSLNRGRLLYELRFPNVKVPYLGIWLNQGGFKGEYNCALEPSTGYYDSLEIAQKLNSLQPIGSGQTSQWSLDIQLKSLVDKR